MYCLSHWNVRPTRAEIFVCFPLCCRAQNSAWYTAGRRYTLVDPAAGRVELSRVLKPPLASRFILSSLGLKSRCQWDCIHSGGYRGESIFLPFPALEASNIPWIIVSPFRSQHWLVKSYSNDITLVLCFCCHFFSLSCNNLCEDIECTQIIQDHLPISRSLT